MSRYDDIINMPHHVSRNRTPMSMENRAAQFAPFAALSGHEEAIAETARIAFRKPELSVEELETLSRRLVYAIERNAEIKITFFQPDELKQDGSFREMSGKIKKIDEIDGKIVFSDRRSVPFGNVMKIEGDIFDDMEF